MGNNPAAPEPWRRLRRDRARGRIRICVWFSIAYLWTEEKPHMRNIDIDNYIFDYIICNKRILFWRFKDFPRNKDLEDRIVGLCQRELKLESENPQRNFVVERWGTSIWKYLNLPEAVLTFYIPAICSMNSPDESIERTYQTISDPSYGEASYLPFIDKLPPRTYKEGLQNIQPNNPLETISVELQYCERRLPQQYKFITCDQEIFFFSKNGETSPGGVFYHSIDNKKIQIPFSYYNTNQHVLLWTKDFPRFFYNAQYQGPAKAVILTDDIALAAQRQRELVVAGIQDIVWLSWHGDLKNYPWKTLEKKTVYFFAATHSGLGLNDILETAHDVDTQLRAVNGPELRLIFSQPSEVTHFYSPLFRDTLPLIIPISQLSQIQTDFAHEAPISFDCFRKKIAPDCNRKAYFLISPFIRAGARTLIWGTNDSGKRTWSLALCHAFVTGKAVLSRLSPPTPGVVLYFHEDDIDLTEPLERLHAFAPWNIQEYTSRNPQLQLSCSQPLLVRHPLKLKELNSQSYSDACNFVAYLGRVACAIQTDLPKMLILDSILAPLIKHPRELQFFLDMLEKHDWTILIQESSRITTWRKILHCDSEIYLEHVVSLDGWDIICRMASVGGSRLESCYRINFDNSNPTVLQKAPCNRKRSGLLMNRSELKKKLAALLKQGIKGKGIAERLKISESMVKKLKDEMGLSKKRRPRTNYSSAESIASSLSDAKR